MKRLRSYTKIKYRYFASEIEFIICEMDAQK